MKIRALAIGAAALMLPFAAVACGGSDDNNSGTRPTAKELSTALGKGVAAGAPTEALDCLGEKIEASDLPNGVLRALVKGEDAEVDKDNEDKYTKMITDATSECVAEFSGASGVSVPE